MVAVSRDPRTGFDLRTFVSGDPRIGWSEDERLDIGETFTPSFMSQLQRWQGAAVFLTVAESYRPDGATDVTLRVWETSTGWSARTFVLDRATRLDPWIQVDRERGCLWAAWNRHEARAFVEIVEFTQEGNEWTYSKDHEIALPDRNVYLPHLAIDEAGNLHLAALTNHPFGSVDIVYTYRDHITGLWSPLQQVNDVPNEVAPEGKLSIAMTADGDGNVWIAYRAYGGEGAVSTVVKLVSVADDAPTYDVFSWGAPRAVAMPMIIGSDRVGFFSPSAGKVSVTLFDVTGRRLGQLVRSFGSGMVLVSLSDVTDRPLPGVYWWRVETDRGARHVLKTVLLR